MGLEIQIDTLEDMCDLMCDNIIPRKEEKEEDGKGMDKSTQEVAGLLDME